LRDVARDVYDEAADAGRVEARPAPLPGKRQTSVDIHHRNPLFGDSPGRGIPKFRYLRARERSLFPSAGMPAWFRDSVRTRWNPFGNLQSLDRFRPQRLLGITLRGVSEHQFAHAVLFWEETAATVVVNPLTTGGRAVRAALGIGRNCGDS